MISTRWLLVGLLGAGLLSWGCGPAPQGDDDDDDNTVITNFSDIQSVIFDQSCAFVSCHGAANPAGGLSLLSGDSCNSLVGVQSTQVAMKRVMISNPGSSYLYLKLIGDSSIVGTPMPPPSGGLSTDKVQAIRDWIDAGATCQ